MDKNPDRIAEQAAEYFARRTSGAASSQRDAMQAWLHADPQHARAYDRTQRLWEQLGELRDDADLQTLKAADLAALRKSHWGFRPGRILAAAAVLVLLIGGDTLLVRYVLQPAPVSYATTLGERRTEILPDGTRVVLDTDSALQARYTRDRRDIELLRGEAQFEVTHDASRPFVVRVAGGTVTALGTRFQVRRDADVATVTLLQGSVEVVRGVQRQTLHPNEQARFSPTGEIAVQTIDPAQVNGWPDGWLRFRGTPLGEVIAEANRYSTRKLLLGDPKLSAVELSGNFRTGDSASIAAAAELVLPVRAETRGRDIVLLLK